MSARAEQPQGRNYPDFVTLLRRSHDTDKALGRVSVADVEAWLLGDALSEDSLLDLFHGLVLRIAAADLPVERGTLHVGTLHPQLYGYAWNWSATEGFCDEVKVSEAVLATDAYRRNPMLDVVEQGETVRARLDLPDDVARYPLFSELAAKGMTDYIALPLRTGGAYHNAVTIATKQAGGFREDQLAEIDRLLKPFALHVERHIAMRISQNVLDTYLGTAAGSQVLNGSIKRGAGAPINAIIWSSDLRGFTDLANRLKGPEVLAVLNEYFGLLAGAVMSHGGEVLKFIGDGLLAVFPFSKFENEQAAAAAALASAELSLAQLDALNESVDRLGDVADWRPLRSGIALHRGEVFFGNVGAPGRLDFTVIGRAVNTASRVEALSKVLERPILVTEPVAALLERPLEAMGEHSLRGVPAPVIVFAPTEAGR